MELHRIVKPAVAVFSLIILFWVGASVFSYRTYCGEPSVKIVGIESGSSYKGAIGCQLHGESGYKIASVTVLLDGQPFTINKASSVRSKNFDLPFNLETSQLTDGKHLFQLEAVDASYHANKSYIQIEFFVDNAPLQAVMLQPDYVIDQGHTFQPKIQVNKLVDSVKIALFSKTFSCHPAGDNSTVYESFIPLDCEQSTGDYLFTVDLMDKVGNATKLSGTLQVKKVDFPRQKGFYVAPEKLADEKEVSMNNHILDEALTKWLEKSPDKKLWHGPFEVPTVVRRISTPYGEIRITPERGRYIHRAIDIVNDPKSVVWASQDGIVIIKDRYLMSGNTIVIDHGLGVVTKYFHLDNFADIEVGSTVKKGEPVGHIGMTGYANGYHLHWEISVGGVSVEPMEWTNKIF